MWPKKPKRSPPRDGCHMQYPLHNRSCVSITALITSYKSPFSWKFHPHSPEGQRLEIALARAHTGRPTSLSGPAHCYHQEDASLQLSRELWPSRMWHCTYCLRANRNLVGLDLALKPLLQFSREQTLTQLVHRNELLLAFLRPVTGVPASTQSSAALSRSDVPGGRAAVATIQTAKGRPDSPGAPKILDGW